MSILRSRTNPRVRRWQRLARDTRARRDEGCALIEGPHLVGAYLASGGKPRAVIVAESWIERREIDDLVRKAGVAPVFVSDGVLRALAEARTPQGLAAEIIVPLHRQALEEVRAAVLLDGIQDAGNIGAILRSAAAFGLPEVLIGPGCADPWSPKVLRAAMGAHFSLRIVASGNPAESVKQFGGIVAVTVPRGGMPIARADLRRRILWIFGAEGRGVSQTLAGHADLEVTIPMSGSSESLNVAVAAAICFYEQHRQAASAHLQRVAP